MADEFSFEEAVGTPLTLKAADRTSKPIVTGYEDYGTVSLPNGSLLPSDKEILNTITTAADKYGVPRAVALAVAQQESNYNPNAIGTDTKWGKAKGIFQYLDSTASGMGIDPMNPTQASDAAAKQLASRLEKGIDWAIAAHFAGDNPKLHGEKTKQYTKEVLAKASAIAKELGEDFTMPEIPVTATNEFSFEDALGDGASDKIHAVKSNEVSLAADANESGDIDLEKAANKLYDTFNPITSIQAAATGVKKGWEGLQEILNRKTIDVEKTPEQLKTDYQQYLIGNKAPLPYDQYVQQYGKTKVTAGSYDDEELAWKEKIKNDPSSVDMLPARFKHLAPNDTKGFIDTLKNPVSLLLNDSLPANFISALANAPEMERKNFDAARKVAMQEEIVDNPDKYPAVSVEAAKKAIQERNAKRDPGIVEMWDNLKQAAKEDPGKFGADLVNSLIADPELLAAPVGLGAKPIQAMRAAKDVAETATIASRAAKIADAIIDSGSTTAAMNIAVGATKNIAETGQINPAEVKMNAAMGYLLGGTLGTIFHNGAIAKSTDLNAAKINGTYEQILRDAAKADVALESVATGKVQAINADKINEALGIKSNTDRKAWIEQRRKEIKSTFKNESDYADYLSFVAEERVAQAEAWKTSQAAAAEKRRAAEEEAIRSQAERKARLQEEFDQAILARTNNEFASEYDAAINENRAFDAARKLNNEEAIEAIFTKDSNQIARVMNKINRRESQLRRPKWQRGEADPKLLARVGAVGVGAGLAYTFSPEEMKMQNSILGGLAGLILPAGGSVLSRMRQAGAVSAEGDIIGLLVRKGKLVDKIEGAELQARDNGWVDSAKAGDQRAMKNIYDEYYKDTTRYVNKFLQWAGPKLALDAEDVAQETFIKVFQNLDQYSKDSPFGAWVKRIARNQALETIEKANALKRGEGYRIVSDEIPGGRDDYSGDVGQGSTVFEKGAGSEIYETPENVAVREQVTEQLQRAFDKLPPDIREAIIMSQLENYTDVEIAQLTNTPLGTIQRRIQRGKDMLLTAAKDEFGVRTPKFPKNKQTGEVDTKLLKAVALGAAGATIGGVLNDKSPVWGMGVGLVAGLLLSGKIGASVVAATDRGLGSISTRVLNHSPKIHRATLDLFGRNLEDTHTNFQLVDPFINRMKQLPKDVQDVVSRAVMTGDPVVIKKLLDYLGDPELIKGYAGVRASLDSLGDKLTTLNRFKRGMREYFPRIVKDKEGLFRAIDKKTATNIADKLKHANADSMRKQGRGLNQAEESAIINQILFVEKRSTQPGWAKDRAIEEITPELLPFYATPAESLHTYIKSAVEDINKAKFFGKNARNMKKGEQEFLDTDASINNMIAEEVRSGKLSDESAYEVSKLLKSVLVSSEGAPAPFISEARNLASAGLLGNFWSAATQLGDVFMQTYLQGMRPTMEAIIRQATGKKFVNMEDFGLENSLTAEFANQSRSSRYLNKVFKASLFAGVDKFGKNTALNAAIARARRTVQTEAGQLKFANKYGEAFGDDISKLIGELKSGKFTRLTKEFAFMELSRSQPVTKFEMPEWWHTSPNVGRSALMLKSFMIKQIDLARRDGYNLIKQGKVAQGTLKLTQLGITLGLAGMASDTIKQLLSNGVSVLTGNDTKPIDVSLSKVPLNLLKTFGITEYSKDHFLGVSKEEAAARREAGDKTARTIKPEPEKVMVDYFTPPFRMFTDIATQDPNMYRYLIPLVGPYVAEQVKKADAEEREAMKNKKGEL